MYATCTLDAFLFIIFLTPPKLSFFSPTHSSTRTRSYTLEIVERILKTSDVLIFAHWRLSTLTQYLTWFGKPPTSTGEAIALYRESTRFTTIEEEELSPYLATLNLTLFLSSQCCNGSYCWLPWQPTLSYISHIFGSTLFS